MSNRTDGYAAAIVALADGEDALAVVEDELLEVARAVADNDDLRATLTDESMPVASRLAFVDSQALQGAHRSTRSALSLVVAAGRTGDLSAIAEEVARRAAAARDRELAEVTVAVPLGDTQRESLQRALEEATGKQLEMKVHVDDRVVGGVRAKVGDTVIDGSVARRLEDVRTRVAR